MGAHLVWLSLKARPNADVRVGRSRARTTGDFRYSVPYGLDQLIVMYLATEEALHGRIIRSTAADICEMFRVSWTKPATMERHRRVVSCWYEPARHPDDPAEMTRRIPIADGFTWQAGNKEFRITLSEDFIHDVEPGAPFSLDAAAQLDPAELDLYLLQVSRLHRGQLDDTPLVGDSSAYAILPGSADPRAQRQKARQYMTSIRRVWPECPYRVSPNGNALIYVPALVHNGGP